MIDIEQSTSCDPRDVVAMASALADPSERALYLEHAIGANGKPTKRRAGFAPSIEAAVRSGRPFCVRARRDILVVDDDSEQDLAIRFAEEYLGDLVPVPCRSGQARRWHLFVKVDDPSEMQGLIRSAKSMGLTDVKAARWIRPPGAPHTFAAPSMPVDMKAADVVEALALRSSLPHHLGKLATRALVQGPSTRSQPSASEALMAATVGMVACGWPVEDMWRCLWMFNGGEKLRRLEQQPGWDAGRVRRWWERNVLISAQQRVAASPTVHSREDAMVTVRSARSWMRCRAWKGAVGGTDRAVLEVILNLAEQSGKITNLGLSCRQVAELAGLGHRSTALKALRRLTVLGIIRRVAWDDLSLDGEQHVGPLAHRYRILVPDLDTEALRDAWFAGRVDGDRATPQQSDPGGCTTLTVATWRECSLDHDAFRWGALGKTAWKVWRALGAEPQTTKELALRLGYTSASALRKQLNRLSSEGLAVEGTAGWARADADLDVIAEGRGTLGKGAAMKLRHQAERSANRVAIANRISSSNVERFVAERLLADSTSGMTYVDLRVAYQLWCGRRRVPVSDFAFYNEVHQLVRGAPNPMRTPPPGRPTSNPWLLLTEQPVPVRALPNPIVRRISATIPLSPVPLTPGESKSTSSTGRPRPRWPLSDVQSPISTGAQP